MSDSETSLATINQASQLLDRARSLEDVIEVRDRASAIAAYARAKGADKAYELALELKLRAERKAGGFLKEMPKNEGGRPSETGNTVLQVSAPTLKDLGIERIESTRWQRLASIPDEKFEEYISNTNEKTQRALLSLASEFDREDKPKPVVPLPTGIYDVVYADPPWQYDVSFLKASPNSHYPTMPVDEIKSLEIPVAEDAILFLWATNPLLEDALEVLHAWGFDYKTNIVWVKDKMGLGFYVRGQHELLLIGTKGDMKPPEEHNRFSSVVNSNVGKHSQKPDEIYSIIEKMYPSSKYLELFARKKREGWVSWGNEPDIV